MKRKQPKVAIVQRVLPHYRVGFYTKLAEKLGRDGIELQVFYGQEARGGFPRSVTTTEPWARRIRNRYFRLGGVEFVWQSGLAGLQGADLIVVEHAGRLVLNYLLLFKLWRGRARLAFWGHGRNLQRRSSWRDSIKAWLMSRADWWFAYTDMSERLIEASGYPQDRITVVNNTIDDTELFEGLSVLDGRSRRDVADSLGLKGSNIAVYLGGLYEEKRIPFLMKAASKLHDSVPGFELVVIGAGPLRELVERHESNSPWIHYVGEVKGRAKAPYLYAARALVMPGAVGLVIVDSFVARVPVITTDMEIHGPEVEYLENGVNGVMTDNTVDAYVKGVTSILTSADLRRRLRDGCEATAMRFTLDSMVDRFATGVANCLATGEGVLGSEPSG